VTVSDSGRKVIFRPGGVRVSSAGVRGIVPSPPPVRSPGGGQGGGHGIGQGSGGGRGHGKGGGNSLAALALALGAVSATGGKVVPSPPDVAGAMTLICSQVLAATQASFDTNTILGGDIPGTSNHLRLVLSLRDTTSNTSNQAFMRLNNDSGANYYYEDFSAHLSSITASEVLANTWGRLGQCASANSSAGVFAAMTVDIPRYAATVNQKSWITDYFVQWSTSTNSSQRGGTGAQWLSTAAVTRIQVFPASLLWAAGSSFYLYGIT
jgi:hypothetical protein